MDKNNAPWMKLDNAAKIFPSTGTKRDHKVFRFVCELREVVQPQLLQQAAEETLESFPNFKSVMRRGLFWYYLEESDLLPVIEEEQEPLCAALYEKNRPGLLFRVTYFGPRINLEVYHVLADGTGAMWFLEEMVCRYLSLSYPQLQDQWRKDECTPPIFRRQEDSYSAHYGKTREKGNRVERAFRFSGRKLPEHRVRAIGGLMSVGQVKALAKKQQATITVMLTAMLLLAIYQEMPVSHRKRPVVISVPVNLRNYFPSDSSRNFFTLIQIRYDFSQNSPEFSQIAASVSQQFQQQLTKEKLGKHINSLIAMEKNPIAGAVPLGLKNLFMRLGGFFASMGETAGLSNVGQVKMPEPFRPYIRLFDVFTATDKLQICMCSFEDAMMVTFSDPFRDPAVQRRFFRMLSSEGIEIEIITDHWEETL